MAPEFSILTVTPLGSIGCRVQALIECRESPEQVTSIGINILTPDPALALRSTNDLQRWLLDELRRLLGW